MEATSAPHPRALRVPRPRRLLAAQSDARLVDHVRKGDEAAFEVLYDRHSAGILGFCRHMLGNTADAEDAVQHTFIAAHADIQRHYQRELHVKAWLYTIARNRCLSMLRGRREQPSADELEIVTDNFTRDVEHREDLRALLGDVTKLPDDQREALVLAEVGDLSHSDIGRILGCEASKVKSLVFQARTALIDRRIARETPCEEIREQLATLRGGALRRSHLRHHLDACPGCSEYRDEVRRQRAMLAIALPVIPSAALKAKVFGGLGLGGSSAAAAAGGGAAATAATGGFSLAPAGGLAKLGVVVALAAGGAGTATVANHGNIPLLHDTAATPASVPAHHHGTANKNVAHSGRTATPVSTNAAAHEVKHKTDGSRRSASGTLHGFTPITGQSNGARARAFAQTRGKGSQTSAAHRHATAQSKAHRVRPEHVKHVATPNGTRQNGVAPTAAPKTSQPQATATTPSATQTQPTPPAQTPAVTPAPNRGAGSVSSGADQALGTSNAGTAVGR